MTSEKDPVLSEQSVLDLALSPPSRSVDSHTTSLQTNSSSVVRTPDKGSSSDEIIAAVSSLSEQSSPPPSVMPSHPRSLPQNAITAAAAAAAAAAASIAIRREDSDASFDDLIFRAASSATAAASGADLDPLSPHNIRVEAQRPYNSLDSHAIDAAIRSAQNTGLFGKAAEASVSSPLLSHNRQNQFHESREHRLHDSNLARRSPYSSADASGNRRDGLSLRNNDDQHGNRNATPSHNLNQSFKSGLDSARLDTAPHVSADDIWPHFNGLSLHGNNSTADHGIDRGSNYNDGDDGHEDDPSSFSFYKHSTLPGLTLAGAKASSTARLAQHQRHFSVDTASQAFLHPDFPGHMMSQTFRSQIPPHPNTGSQLSQASELSASDRSLSSMDQQYMSPYAFQPQELRAQAHALAAAAAAAVAAQQQHQQQNKMQNTHQHGHRQYFHGDSSRAVSQPLPRSNNPFSQVPPRASRTGSSHALPLGNAMLPGLGSSMPDFGPDTSRQPAPIPMLPYPTPTSNMHPGPTDYLNAQAAAAAAAAAAAVYQSGSTALAGMRLPGGSNSSTSHMGHMMHSGRGSHGGSGGRTPSSISHSYSSGRGGRGHGKGHRNVVGADHGFDTRNVRNGGTGREGYSVVGITENHSHSINGYASGMDHNAEANGDQPSKYLSFSDVVGRAEELARDQHGCRSLQTKLEEGNPTYINAIFEECFEKFVELMTDPFGNYLCQKLFEYCSDAQRLALVERCAPSIPQVSTNMHGTRAVQRMVECLSTPEQVRAICNSLAPAAVVLMKDINGNHVIQRCLNCMEMSDNQFVYDAVANNCFELATHRHGCCVMQRCMDHASASQRDQLARQINLNALPLVQNAFGNYVVQYVLELNEPLYTAEIINQLRGHISELSMQKFSSNVVEKSLQHGDRDIRRGLIHELISNADVMRQLLHDAYGNYVIQRALQVAESPQLEQICEAIRPHLNALKQSPYGKRIQAKIMKRMPKCISAPTAMDTACPPSLQHTSLPDHHPQPPM